MATIALAAGVTIFPSSTLGNNVSSTPKYRCVLSPADIADPMLTIMQRIEWAARTPGARDDELAWQTDGEMTWRGGPDLAANDVYGNGGNPGMLSYGPHLKGNRVRLVVVCSRAITATVER